MKKIIVACGAGIATSTIAIQKIKTKLEEKGLLSKVQFTQCTVAEIPMRVEGHNLIVTTASTSQDFGIPVISGLPFITGMGIDKVMEDIIEKLDL
ncbi:PTS sugar transporter subunit IIB [Clostridium fallax]|uniref:PTS system IIB component, Gat family n=1 Tax=Clostridium fallax TaxID=1533 RepID=A0A1M4Z599_9CLOT|nr:PTS sugar transporter subunit IIB [Clostridium fallax]SHF13180.1 PTS system IIB component, Gat family [Clostridium fallax]SQB05890.1 PTS system transporter subunit IIB [Clostridium fallax]